MRTAKRLGIKTVAVYSEADARSMHIRMADEAYCIGGALSKDSYLQMERVLDVAKRTGAQAIHPGYGFLSENPHFVEMVEKSGIAFVGPSSAPMYAMGDKISSKRVAKEANCHTIPGYDGPVPDAETAARLAKDIGYPVMIKASAGGGGKGMRVAYNDHEIMEGFKLCKAEAMSAFGSDSMLIEKFIEDPHHIEIQVIADSFGNVAAFPERCCVLQSFVLCFFNNYYYYCYYYYY
jgi:propionyl-CoA carboxylase alpha chain